MQALGSLSEDGVMDGGDAAICELDSPQCSASITWDNPGVLNSPEGQKYLLGFPYTLNDAYLGQCAGTGQNSADPACPAIKEAINTLASSCRGWDITFANAFRKLLRNGAVASTGGTFSLTGGGSSWKNAS
jgi:hypothetical protein